MKALLATLTLVTSILFQGEIQAQGPAGAQPNPKLFEGEGRMLLLRYVPGDRSAKLYVMGRKTAEADFDLKKVKIVSVQALREGRTESLKFEGAGEEYTIQSTPKSLGKSLRVNVLVEGEEDEVTIDLSKP